MSFSLVDSLIRQFPSSGVVKFHPSFELAPKLRTSVENYIHENYSTVAKICPAKTCLEIEMMFEKKVIIGPKSSLETYAPFFWFRV